MHAFIQNSRNTICIMTPFVLKFHSICVVFVVISLKISESTSLIYHYFIKYLSLFDRKLIKKIHKLDKIKALIQVLFIMFICLYRRIYELLFCSAFRNRCCVWPSKQFSSYLWCRLRNLPQIIRATLSPRESLMTGKQNIVGAYLDSDWSVSHDAIL